MHKPTIPVNETKHLQNFQFGFQIITMNGLNQMINHTTKLQDRKYKLFTIILVLGHSQRQVNLKKEKQKLEGEKKKKKKDNYLRPTS